MDRLNRTLAGCGLALLVAATGSGCRNLPSNVPPGRPYTPDGRQSQTGPGGFGSEPHPMSGAATANVIPPYSGGAAGMTPQIGTPPPGPANGYGAPAGGPPGSSMLGAGQQLTTPTPGPGGGAESSSATTMGGGGASGLPAPSLPGSPGSFPPPQ